MTAAGVYLAPSLTCRLNGSMPICVTVKHRKDEVIIN